jgi:hypothetical protein
MPVGGMRNNGTDTIGSSYRKDPLYPYAKAFGETAKMILKEDGFDLFEEPQRVLRRNSSKQTMKNFFTEGMFDKNNTLLDAEDVEDLQEMADTQFENDVEAVYEHAAPADYSPMVGMALPIHKLILMNNVFDKGGIQKVTAAQPKFPISLERRILVKPDGTEIDMFLEQNLMTAAIDSTNPEKVIELTLPVTETTDIVSTYFGGTSMDNLDISTYISAVQVENVQIDIGDAVPDADGYIDRDATTATAKSTSTVWFRTDLRFTPNYGGPNHFDRVVMKPLSITYKDGANSGAVTTIKAIISGSMNKNRLNIADLSGKIKKIRLTAKLDSSSAMLETCHTMWKVDTDIVEIPSAVPINTTISPNEVKDIAAMYNVNQLTKHMSMFKTVLSNYKDDKIKAKLDDSFKRLDERTGFYDSFDFAPPSEYALSAVEYRQRMFMDFLDNFASKMLQVLNDPNMTFTVFGDPLIVRKITPKEYSYTAPASIGPVTLDYTQTICNMSDKRVYNFIGSDKMRNTNELMILINPNNSERIIYRIYDYQLYVSNEIRNIANPALPAIHAFERWQFVEYQPVQGRVEILHPTGLKTA